MNDFLSTFETAIADDVWQLDKQRLERWRTRNLTREASSGCRFCGKALSLTQAQGDASDFAPVVLAHLVSTDLGGSHSKENLLAACHVCAARAKDLDWLAWKGKAKNLTPAMATRRQDVLARSENHLLRTRDCARTRPYLISKLQQRWQHPRFVARACLTEQYGLVAFAQHIPMPEGIALLVRLTGGSPVAGVPRIFRVPSERFLDLVWQLIDLNAWVRRLDLGTQLPDPTQPDDSFSRWHETFTSVGDIHRRREKLPWVHPFKRSRPWHEKPMDPRTRLHLAALLALRTGDPLDKNWLTRHREEDDLHVANGKERCDKLWNKRRS